jgi:exodeoxyribonuclease VII small subunit
VTKNKKSFSKMLEELEKIAAELEEGELDLEAAIKKYEQGIKVFRECRKFLDSARKKVEVLSKEAGGNFVAKELVIEGEDEESASDEKETGGNSSEGKTLFE